MAEQTKSIKRVLTYWPRRNKIGFEGEVSKVERGLSTELSIFLFILRMVTKGYLIKATVPGWSTASLRVNPTIKVLLQLIL